MADRTTTEVAQRIEQAVLAGEEVAAPAAAAARFAVLLGLDAAFAHVNPLLAETPPVSLAEFALRYAEAASLDSGAHPGALLPRFARPGRRGQTAEDLADAFGSVIRVSGPAWEICEHAALPARSRLSRSEREAGVRVATAPLIRDPDELEWELKERAGVRYYRIRPA